MIAATAACWPLCPKSMTGESLSSWLQRIATGYGLTLHELLEYDLGYSRDCLDKGPPLELVEKIALRTGRSVDEIWSMTIVGNKTLRRPEPVDAAGFTEIALLQQAVSAAKIDPKQAQQLCTSFVELRRSVASDRIRAGLANAKARGVRLGRPEKDPSATERIIAARKLGFSLRRIARQENFSATGVLKILRRASNAPQCQIT
jgi:hypothetical protein